MTSAKPTREQADLAEVLELVLDKGIVINADIAVTVGDTEMIGIELRAAIASFETAAEYGLAFPSGTDMRRVEQASGRETLEGDDAAVLDDDEVDLGISASSGGATAESEESEGTERTPPGRRPAPDTREDDEIASATEETDDASDAGEDEDDAEADADEAAPESDDTSEEDS